MRSGTKWKKSIINLHRRRFKSEMEISLEDRMMQNEKREIIAFIEAQDNIFKKIENNINQYAKIANSSKWISEMEIKIFNQNLYEIRRMKEKQNDMFKIIIELLGK